MPDYLTTKELAALLRIKERKVYDLAATGKVPCTKATGRLLFPRDQIETWIASNQTATGPQPRQRELPAVVLGSHDPLLEWALRDSRSGLATYFDGSVDGLERFALGEGLATGLHIYDEHTGGWNTPDHLSAVADLPVVMMEWARRERGLVVKPANVDQIHGLADLAELTEWRFAARQPEAGAQVLFECLANTAGLASNALATSVIARSEGDAVLAVADGSADVSFGLRAIAAQFNLGFVPIIEERFDLIVDRRAWFEPPLQALRTFCATGAFAARASQLAGYDISGHGTIHFNGP